MLEFQRREIQVKDIDRGLIDFPALLGGKEVFLCWEQDEEDIEFWHDLDAGYAGTGAAVGQGTAAEAAVPLDESRALRASSTTSLAIAPAWPFFER